VCDGRVGPAGPGDRGELIRRSDTELVGGMVSSDSVHLDADIGELAGAGYIGLSTCVALEDAAKDADVVIDASAPHVTVAIAERLAEAGGPALATGVTGFDEAQQASLAARPESLAFLQASNFSLGVAVVERLIAEAAARLEAEHYDLEITEAHHKHKVDAPSGTALTLGQAAAAARGDDFETPCALRAPAHQRTPADRGDRLHGCARRRRGRRTHRALPGRGGGDQSVGHRAFDRIIFARGAVEAALWLKGPASRSLHHAGRDRVTEAAHLERPPTRRCLRRVCTGCRRFRRSPRVL
jgi:4-hydroxy-tetrahydrodipicolinate reductase